MIIKKSLNLAENHVVSILYLNDKSWNVLDRSQTSVYLLKDFQIPILSMFNKIS